MMCTSNIAHWCFAFLLVSSSSKSQENSTNGDEGNNNSTMRDDHFISFVENQHVESILCNSCENFMNNTNKMEDKSSVNSTKNDREQNNQMSMESYANSTTEISYSILQETNENLTETEGKNNSMSNQLHGNSSINDCNNTTTIVPYEACKNVTCIQLCCPFGNVLTLPWKCVSAMKNYNFPSIFTYGNNSQGVKLNERFPLTFHDPCIEQEVGCLYNDPSKYMVFANGSLHQGSNLILPKSYCLAILMDFPYHYTVITCMEQPKVPIYVTACPLVSLPFLLLTFVVYSILPDLQTMHGYTLRAYVASLFVTYAIMYFGQQNASKLVKWTVYVLLAYIFNFTYLSSFFWLNVACFDCQFDIWWTLSGFRSHQADINRDKKKFIIYSLYAWGITFIINVICIIMGNAGIPETYVRPQMCRKKFWPSGKWAKSVYFYVPMIYSISINICFFIVTSITLLHQNKYTTSQLRASESKRYNENKQRFYMYLKLFIVMGIGWVMELLSWFNGFYNESLELSIPSKMVNALQGVTIFIIFVCKKNIKKMLLKRFDGWSCGPCYKISTYDDTVTNTTSTSTTQVSIEEIRSPN